MPKSKTTFILEETTVERTGEYIDKLKLSNTVGYDRIMSRTIKMAKSILAILLTHAINCSIRQCQFPSSLKILRILPILKEGKNSLQKDAYRLISNLHSFEKVFEEHVKTKLEAYLEKIIFYMITNMEKEVQDQQ